MTRRLALPNPVRSCRDDLLEIMIQISLVEKAGKIIVNHYLAHVKEVSVLLAVGGAGELDCFEVCHTVESWHCHG